MTTKFEAQLCTKYVEAGGLVRGCISIINSPDEKQHIEWVASQVHGHVWVNDDEHPVPIVDERLASLSLDENPIYQMENLPDITTFSSTRPGACIYSSKPHILLSEASVPVSDCNFVVALPKQLCPSFRGKSAGVFYVISITAKLKNHPSVFIHLRFDVVGSKYLFNPEPLARLSTDSIERRPSIAGDSLMTSARKFERKASYDEDSSPQPVPPFAVRNGIEPPLSIRPDLLHGRHMTEVHGKSQVSIYSIGKQKQHLVRLMLYKQYYFPGDTILGSFDFSESDIPCFQISACLAQEEKSCKNALSPGKIQHTTIAATEHAYTTHNLRYNMYLRIPPTALPTIETDVVTLKWKIRFEFVTTAANRQKGAAQVFQWSVPVIIQPPVETQPHHSNIAPKFYVGPKSSVAL